jgi:signal transduction histidine kinase
VTPLNPTRVVLGAGTCGGPAAADPAILDLVAALGSRERRREAARALAAAVGAEDLLLFLADPALGVLLPAPGFPQTLPRAGAWRAFLAACTRAGAASTHRGGVPSLGPDPQVETVALGCAATDGSVLVLLGGTPSPEALDVPRRLLPLVAAAVQGELAARAADGQAALAREAATRAEAMARSLDQNRRELEEALRREAEARDQVEAALRARDEFLSVAAHELKTPITSLRGVAQLNARRVARVGGLEPHEVEALMRVVETQTTRLNALITQLLDVSRIEAGKLALNRAPTELVSTVREVVATLQATGKGRAVRVVVPSDCGALVVSADPVRLEQVVTNLVDNAVKFSPPGGDVLVSVARDAGGHARICVRDWGLGVPPERRAHIFDRFFQAHSEGHLGGMGLGLYISKQIVEQHGGTIRAEFPEDGGSRFVVTLPC